MNAKHLLIVGLIVLLAVMGGGIGTTEKNLNYVFIKQPEGPMNWTNLQNYPAACSDGQYVSAIDDTLTCGTPAGGGGDTNWQTTPDFNDMFYSKFIGLQRSADLNDFFVQLQHVFLYDSNANTECDGNTVLTGLGACQSITDFYLGGGGLTWGDVNANIYGKLDVNAQFVPYVGAMKDVNIGSYDFNLFGQLQARRIKSVDANSAYGLGAIAFGDLVTAFGDSSAAFGSETLAEGWASFAAGYQTKARGDNSVAVGSASVSSGDYSVAMGSDTTASGDYSAAFGKDTVAEGIYSVAMGRAGKAKGDGSVVFGETSGVANVLTAFGLGSVVMGYADVNSAAEGTGSIALGYNVISKGEASVTLGKNLTNYKANSVLMQDLNALGDANLNSVTATAFFGSGAGLTGIPSQTDINANFYGKLDVNNQFVPYIGATKDMDLGFYYLTTSGGIIIADGGEFNFAAGTPLTLNYPTNDALIISEGTTDDLEFWTANTPRIIISAGGNINILNDANFLGDMNVFGDVNARSIYATAFFGSGAGLTSIPMNYTDLNKHLVPYIGATRDVNLGGYGLRAFGDVNFNAIQASSFFGPQSTTTYFYTGSDASNAYITLKPRASEAVVGWCTEAADDSSTGACLTYVSSEKYNELASYYDIIITPNAGLSLDQNLFVDANILPGGGAAYPYSTPVHNIGSPLLVWRKLFVQDMNAVGDTNLNSISATAFFGSGAGLTGIPTGSLDTTCDTNETCKIWLFGLDLNAGFHLISDLNLFYYKKSDINANWYGIFDLNRNFHSLFDLNKFYYKVSDVNAHFHSLIDLNAFYYKKADVNAGFYGKLDVNAHFVPFIGSTKDLNLNFKDVNAKSISAVAFFGSGAGLTGVGGGTVTLDANADERLWLYTDINKNYYGKIDVNAHFIPYIGGTKAARINIDDATVPIGFYVTRTMTDPAIATTGLQSTITLNAATANNAKSVYGLVFSAATKSASTYNYTGALYGVQGFTYHQGAASSTLSYAIGMKVGARVSSAGSITNVEGIEVLSGLDTGSTGNITTNSGIFIGNPLTSGSGKITTNRGIYIADQTAGSTNYAIYSAGGDSYFANDINIAGKLTLGTNTDIGLDAGDLNVTEIIYSTITAKSPVYFRSSDGNYVVFCYLAKYGKETIMVGEWTEVNEKREVITHKDVEHPACIEKKAGVEQYETDWRQYVVEKQSCEDSTHAFNSFEEWSQKKAGECKLDCKKAGMVEEKGACKRIEEELPVMQ